MVALRGGGDALSANSPSHCFVLQIFIKYCVWSSGVRADTQAHTIAFKSVTLIAVLHVGRRLGKVSKTQTTVEIMTRLL